MKNTTGYLSIVLHSHLPYVLSHGRWPHGTDWLCEAAAETYLPIIKILNELVNAGFHPKLTVGLSPVLCEQLAHERFKEEFVTYCSQKISAARHDIKEFSRFGQSNLLANAQRWEAWFEEALRHFVSLEKNIVGEFKRLQNAGVVEIITCGATHGYYPLLSRDESLQAQTKAAVANYQKHFGSRPRGIWLPECAYRPRYQWSRPVGVGQKQLRKGADEFLSENGIDFFIIDTPLLKGGRAAGVYIDRFDALKLLWAQQQQHHKPRAEEFDKTPREAYLVSTDAGDKKPVAVYTRDPETGLLVWSGEHGYPGDGHYLDFHKKRFPGGLRYWAVTSPKSDLADKVEYVYESAAERTSENSTHYASRVVEILSNYKAEAGREGILVAPYDAELFGHWWYEGPLFLKQVLQRVEESKVVALSFLSEDLDRRKPRTIVSIPEGSWGQGNHHYIWLNEQTAWTWKHIYECEDVMCDLAKRWSQLQNRNLQLENVLKQLARSLMLMSASDWQFLISTFAARDYAEMRLANHYEDFRRLAAISGKILNGEVVSSGEWTYLEECKERDSLFPEMDLNWFARVEYPAELTATA